MMAYNPYFSAYFFSQNSVFLSQQISQQCFSAGLSAHPNGAMIFGSRKCIGLQKLCCFFASGCSVCSRHILIVEIVATVDLFFLCCI
jgi:hypothetical protein